MNLANPASQWALSHGFGCSASPSAPPEPVEGTVHLTAAKHPDGSSAEHRAVYLGGRWQALPAGYTWAPGVIVVGSLVLWPDGRVRAVRKLAPFGFAVPEGPHDSVHVDKLLHVVEVA